MCFATIVFGSNLRILFNWLRISNIAIAAIGVTFLDLQVMMYFRKWSQIRLASVWPGLPSYRGCVFLIMDRSVSLCVKFVCIFGK